MEEVYDEKIMQPGFGNLLPINLTLDLIPKGYSLFAIVYHVYGIVFIND